MPETAIIILHWHNAKEVNQMLNQISTWNHTKYRTILVDNSLDYASEHNWPWLAVIRPEVNLGFSGGCNFGMDSAQASGCRNGLLLNADVTIHEEDVDAMLLALELDNGCAAVAPVLKETLQGETTYHKGGRNPLFHNQTRITCANPADKSDKPDYLPGTVVLIRMKAWLDVGPLDEQYFFSGEIADWFLRLNKTTWDFLLIETIIVEHHSSGNEDHRKKHYIYYSLRNRFLFIKKFGGSSELKLKSSLIKNLRRQMLGALLRLNLSKLTVVYQAVVDGSQNHFGKSPKY